MQLISTEYAKDSIENYLVRYTTGSQIMYWVILLATVAVMAALPFIYVDVSIQEQGIIRSGADSALFAEIDVSPIYIGSIYPGMSVKIQVASFNYNEWGMIAGEVTEISSDYFTDSSGKNEFYKVKCRMEKDYLVRQNGTKGMLKKGMPVLSHFIITKRSLFNLLYQKADDWINPTQYTAN